MTLDNRFGFNQDDEAEEPVEECKTETGQHLKNKGSIDQCSPNDRCLKHKCGSWNGYCYCPRITKEMLEKKPKQYDEYYYNWKDAQEAIEKHEKINRRTSGRPMKNTDFDKSPKEYKIWYEREREEDAFQVLPSDPVEYQK